MMDAIRRAVVAANHYGPQDVPELRMRMNLNRLCPACSQARPSTTTRGAAISDFAATRIGQPADSLYPLRGRPGPWRPAAPPMIAGRPGRRRT